MLKLVEANPEVHVTWVVFSAEGERGREAELSARAFLRGAHNVDIIVKNFRTSYFPVQVEEIKDYFETLKDCRPDLIFTHYRDDRHQDHRILSDLAWNTFRSHVVLEYEIPKYDGDFGSPNVFIPVTRRQCDKKVQILQRCFKSQVSKHWFSPEIFLAVPRLRGMECDSPTAYAEAFYGRKVVLD